MVQEATGVALAAMEVAPAVLGATLVAPVATLVAP